MSKFLLHRTAPGLFFALVVVVSLSGLTAAANSDAEPPAVGRQNECGMAGWSGQGPNTPNTPWFGQDVETDVVGQPAVEGLTLNRSTLLDGVVYAVSTRQTPMSFVGFDVDAEEVVIDIDVPTTSGVSWQIGSAGEKVYFVTDTPEMFEFDTSTQELTVIDGLPADAFTYDMAVAEDGRVYIGSGATGIVYEYHPDDGTFTSVRYNDEEPNYPSAVTANSETLFVGTSGLYRYPPGQPADLFAIDRESGDAESILPSEITGPNVYGIASSEELVAASMGLGAPAELLVMDADDHSTYTVVKLDDEAFFDRIAIVGRSVYATGTRSGKLYEYDVDKDELNLVATPLAGAPTRNIHVEDGRLIGASAAGVIWTYDLQTGEVETFDLVAAGARGSAQTVFSVAAGADRAYVGGSNIIGVHDLVSGEYRSIVAGGEAKAMTMVGDDLYVAMYPYGVLLKVSPDSDSPELVTDWGREGFNRPTDIYFDRKQDRLLTTVQRDIQADGALGIYDLSTGESKTYVRPTGDASPLSVTALRNTVFVGAQDGSLVAIDGATGEVEWSTVPVPGEGGITGLVVERQRVYGVTEGGTIFGLDPDRQSLSVEASHAIAGSPGKIVANRGDVYAVSTEQLVRMDPRSGETEVVLDGLGPANVPGLRPSLAVDETTCDMYVIDGVDLVRVRLPGPGFSPRSPGVGSVASGRTGGSL